MAIFDTLDDAAMHCKSHLLNLAHIDPSNVQTRAQESVRRYDYECGKQHPVDPEDHVEDQREIGGDQFAPAVGKRDTIVVAGEAFTDCVILVDLVLHVVQEWNPSMLIDSINKFEVDILLHLPAGASADEERL